MPFALLSSALAPTASVSPSSLSEAEKPNWSPSPKFPSVPASPVFEALMYACCDQVPFVLTKT